MPTALALLALSAAASLAQDVITPTGTFVRNVPAAAAMSTDETKPAYDVFGGSGASFATGKNQQANVETKVLRGKLFGPLKCKPLAADPTKEECTATTLFSFELNSYMVDAAGQQLIALKEYVMSAKGSPFAVRIPMDFIRLLSFTSYHPAHNDLPQSWIAGLPNADARVIPTRLASGETQYNISGQFSYALEAHGDLSFESVPGTAFVTLVPSISYVVGDSLVAALLPLGASQTSWLPSLAYAFGYQFGGQSGTAVRLSGALSARDLRDGRGMITVGLRKALGALTPHVK